MSISTRLRTDADHIWQQIFNLPFVTELFRGTLPREKFHMYMLQDYSYLVDAVRNFSTIASRATSIDVMRDVLEIAHIEATSELQGYEECLRALGYTLDDAVKVEPLLVNVSYRNFLLATSSLRSTQEALVSVLPCFWSYLDMAEYHKEVLDNNQNTLYVDWASVYLTEDYRRLVEHLKRLVNRVCGDFPYRILKETFLTSSRYEYLYWDAVYTMKAWPI